MYNNLKLNKQLALLHWPLNYLATYTSTWGLTLIYWMRGKITPHATKIIISLEPFKIERCALVTFSENDWATEWHYARLDVITRKSNMAAETGSNLTVKRFSYIFLVLTHAETKFQNLYAVDHAVYEPLRLH